MEQKNYLYYSLLLGLGGLGLTAYGMFRQSRQSQSEEKSKRLLRPGDSFVLIGDSIGVGLQDHLSKLSHDYGSSFDSLVKIGTTVTYWNQHVDSRDAGYDLILLSLGSNDVVGDPTQQAQAMNELIDKLTARGAPVYWIVPPSFRIGHFKPKQQIFADMLADRGVFPLEVDGPQQSVASDPMHLHLTPQGYRTYAAQIFDAITSTSLGCQGGHIAL